MPSKKQYNLVHNDEYDTRIPLHSEEAFHRGIVFHAKFIGSMEVPRPTSRVEIVAAMRRIRYEFKAKGIKKKKVTLEVSVDGLKVTLRKKKKKQQQWMDENKIYLMHHPIYRIFYVSHDSHDLKIFSYIARDGSSNTFKCNVFKSSKKHPQLRTRENSRRIVRERIAKRAMLKNSFKSAMASTELSMSTSSPGPGSPLGFETTPRPRKKLSFKEPEIFNYLKMRKPSMRPKMLHAQNSVDLSFDENPFEEENEDLDELESQAMRVVRTVGQAFEVCHKLSINNTTEDRDPRGDKDGESHGENYHGDVYEDQDEIPNEQSQPSPPPVHKDISLLGDTEDSVPEQTSVTCLLRSHDGPATTTSTSPIRQSPSGTVTSECGGLLVGGELTALKHEIQLLRERLEQQSQQTRAAVAHARLLQDQLAAETAARVEAQARTHQLLVQNKELLEHISALVSHLREQERVSGGHITSQSQIPSTPASMQQNAAAPDLSSLGQCQRTGGQSSPWELDPPTFPYCSYLPDTLYSGGLNAMGIQGNNATTDQLQFQTQLLERLHNLSPFQPQRSPYNTPSPYAMGPSLLLPPCGGPTVLHSSLQIDSASSMDQKTITPGILKLDKTSLRSSELGAASSAAMQVGPSSPSQSQSSASRQSVTFGTVECQRDGNYAEENSRIVADARYRDDMQRISVAAMSTRANPAGETPQNLAQSTEKSTVDDEGNDSEDDYSASVCAIMQRRNSTRRQSRRKRRPSSPFGVDVDSVARRRSSAYTTSSGDTVISMEESGNQEQIFENLKLHKEVLGGVKQQPWPLRRKIRLVRQAKAYVRRHEGALQERLAQRRSTKDVIARVSLFVTQKWQYFRRELINLRTWLVPWEIRIMEIESHFGSAVASYFTFLRWLFWINLVIAATLTAFVAIPEMLTANATLAGERKIMLKEESVKSKHLLTLWEFEGLLKYSPFFYGWYTNQDSNSNYRLPMAYFVTNLVVYTYSFVAILRKMAENSRLSKLTEKEDEYVFSWKLFTGWDFMIGNPETAHNRTASIVLGFKEVLLEEAEKQKDNRNWKIISMRIFVNVAVLSLLTLSAYAVIEVVGRSTTEIDSHNWWRQNEITIVMSLITSLFPIFFEILGFLESYHPRKQLRIQLARIMVLNLLNLYSLIFALFQKVNSMKDDLSDLKPTNTNCVYKMVACGDELTRTQQIATLASLSLVLISNVTHSHAKRQITEPTLTSIRQETYFLNPFLDDDTLDYSDIDYESYLYETSNSSDEFYTASYEEQNSSIEDNGTYGYDTSSTVIANYLTDSTIVEDFYTNSIWSQDENATSTIIETSTMEDSSTITDDFTDKTIITSSSLDNEVSSTGKFSSTVEITPRTVTTISSESSLSTLQSRENYTVKCFEKNCTTTSPKNLAIPLEQLDPNTRRKLRRLCWETMFGQELAKLTVMDLILTILTTLSMDFFRAVFVRYMNNCWCWDLEKQFPQYGDFKIAENILHLVYNQGMVWMGMFFSPGLTALNLLKLGILMYLRSWAVLTCNVPHEVVFRASRSNNFYFALLLTMLFLCVLPVGYAIVWVEPSWHCGPFSGYPKIYNLATQTLINSLPQVIQRCLDYVASPGIIIPLIVLMTLIIYYMASLAGSLREANNDLRMQLRHERTEERRKLFKIAEKRQNVADVPLSRWKKILPALPQARTELSRNSEITRRNDTQVAIGNSSDTMEDKGWTNNDAEEDSSRREQISSSCNNEKRTRGENDSGLNGTSSGRRPINLVGQSWDSQSSEQSVIPEIQLNDEERAHGSVELSNVSKNRDQETT